MSLLRRLQVVVATVISVGFVGIIYNELGLLLIDQILGESSGPFDIVAERIETVVPLVLALLLLGIIAWFLVSSVREERVQRRVR